jgi:two-component system sensor histidine kinase AlgZ
MPPIIRQNTIALELPDFRNLGTILRVLLAVNGVVAIAALVREPQIDLWAAQWLDIIAVVEPPLIAELAILYAIAPWLTRQSGATGALWSRR